MKRNTVVCLLALLLASGPALSGCAAAAGDTSAAATAEVSAASDTDSDADSDTSDEDGKTDADGDTEAETTSLVTTLDDLDLADMFTQRDESGTYDEEDVTAVITLSGDTVSIDGTGVAADGTTVTITEAGVYVLSGTLDDGEIIVDAGDADKVQLVLNGVDITNADGPAILVRSADKVFVTLAEGTKNTLSDTGEAYAADASVSSSLDGVIFSKADLILNGSGSLSINASYANGIVGKDDLKITGGTYTITAADKGIEANDSIRIENADITIDAGDDGIHTNTDDTAGKGYVCIISGTLTISAGDDGIHAATALVITGGTITVVTSYEGLEGDSIDITGGNIDVTASDDGLNAAFGSSETEDAAPQGGRGGGMSEADASYLCISGGSIHVTAGGDGIDSNGTFLLEGGTVLVDGPSDSGNGALDVGSSATVTGGTIAAAGSSGMAVAFGENSTQYSLLYFFSETISGGTEVVLTDADGNEVLSFTPSKDFSSIVISTEDLTKGEYTITTGSCSDTVTIDSISSQAGTMTQDSQQRGGRGAGPGASREDFSADESA